MAARHWPRAEAGGEPRQGGGGREFSVHGGAVHSWGGTRGIIFSPRWTTPPHGVGGLFLNFFWAKIAHETPRKGDGFRTGPPQPQNFCPGAKGRGFREIFPKRWAARGARAKRGPGPQLKGARGPAKPHGKGNANGDFSGWILVLRRAAEKFFFVHFSGADAREAGNNRTRGKMGVSGGRKKCRSLVIWTLLSSLTRCLPMGGGPVWGV